VRDCNTAVAAPPGSYLTWLKPFQRRAMT